MGSLIRMTPHLNISYIYLHFFYFAICLQADLFMQCIAELDPSQSNVFKLCRIVYQFNSSIYLFPTFFFKWCAGLHCLLHLDQGWATGAIGHAARGHPQSVRPAHNLKKKNFFFVFIIDRVTENSVKKDEKNSQNSKANPCVQFAQKGYQSLKIST